MVGQKRKTGIKAIKKALTECALDPEKSVWFKIVSDAGNDYLLRRSNELLQEILVPNQIQGNPHNAAQIIFKLDQAIALLGLVKARYNEGIELGYMKAITNETVQA